VSDVPTLSAWLGGADRLAQVVQMFYREAAEDALLRPLFAQLSVEHIAHVTRFIDEVFGGPKTYSAEHGGHVEMVRRHVGKHIHEQQRQRWMHLWLQCADACKLPDDPELRSALVGYLEWGSRLAVQNSNLAEAPAVPAAMPRWGWGEVGGPYVAPADERTHDEA
jgi:hemoglobin